MMVSKLRLALRAEKILTIPGPGPSSHPFPAPVTFSKAEIQAAYGQAKEKAASHAPFPKDWLDKKKKTGYN